MSVSIKPIHGKNEYISYVYMDDIPVYSNISADINLLLTDAQNVILNGNYREL